MLEPENQPEPTPSRDQLPATLPDNVEEVFSSRSGFELAQRIARALSESSLVPNEYRSNIPNCLIAVEMAARLRASPVQVMQSLDVIHGRPAWRSQFIIAAVNSCGKFSPLRFQLDGEGMTRSCTASAIELKTGEVIEGPAVTMQMAKAEGWLDRQGSKWRTLPELMLRYRAAAFFGRLYAPEILLGMQTAEEAADVIDVTPERTGGPQGVAGAKQALAGGG
jgi:hypothetical protein